MRKMLACMLIILFSFLMLLPYAVRAEEVSPPVEVYNIKMFADDMVLNSPINDYYYWLEIRPGIVLNNVLIDIWYSCSDTIIKEISSLTVSVNGRPLASSHIAREGDYPGRLTAVVPLELLRKGMNEIKITTTQRSIEKTCQDVDNKANWVVLHKNSVIHLEGTAQKARLHDYPYPFINHLALSPVNAEIVLPSSPDRETVEAMLKIASDWGYRLRGGNLQNLRVITGEADNGPNQVLVSVLKEKGGKEEGYLNLTSDAGLYRLHVSGSDAEGLKKAASFLASDFIKQAESDEMRIKEYMEKKAPQKDMRETRSITLKDLGYGEINLTGAFHQRTMVTVKRPPGWTVGPGSYVELYFRHSTLLNPERSAATVYINGRPLKSIALNAGNAEKGVLKVPIPEDELDKSVWNIEFAFYHDIGMADCSKRYEEIAWSVIEANTRVYLTSGKKQAVLKWSDFPNFNLRADNLCAIWLPARPSDAELTLAFLVAARLGQVYGHNLEWKVYLGEKGVYDKEKNLLVITRHEDINSWKQSINSLAFYKDEKGHFKADEKYSIPSDYIAGSAVCQVIAGRAGGITYFISTPDPKGTQNLVAVFAVPEKMTRLTEEVMLISSSGKMLGLNAGAKEVQAKKVFNLKILNIETDKIRTVYIILLSLAFIGTLGILWWVVRRSR